MTDTAPKAYRRAVENGSLEAWLDGRQIQWSADRTPAVTRGMAWFDLDAGSAPDFAALGRHWRIKPVPPVVKVIATADKYPHEVKEDSDIIIEVHPNGSLVITTVGEFRGDFWMEAHLSSGVDFATLDLRDAT